MRVLQTTLLTGPYDWDAAVLPRAEFDARLTTVRAALAAAGQGALLVNGYAGDFGAMSYLTGFVPKLGPALALVPMTGGIRLIVSGTDLMIPQARLLTPVEDLRNFANVPKLVTEWLAETKGGALASWGAGAMAHGLHRAISAAAGTLTPLDETLDALRRRKSPRELELIRETVAMLGAGVTALIAAARRGDGARAAALAAERAAIAGGAQDARCMVSARPGGAPLPVDGSENPVVDPLLAALAVQHAGYWAEGFVTVARQPGAALARAEAALDAVLAAARPGTSFAALTQAAQAALAPLTLHPMLAGGVVHAIGLSLDESGPPKLEPGGVYALRAGAQGGGSDAAIVSAMIAVTASGSETLWSAPRRTGGA